jgi:hypothetical protein
MAPAATQRTMKGYFYRQSRSTDHTNSATLFLVLNFVLLVCFVGFAYLVALSSKTLSGNRSRSVRSELFAQKNAAREPLAAYHDAGTCDENYRFR